MASAECTAPPDDTTGHDTRNSGAMTMAIEKTRPRDAGSEGSRWRRGLRKLSLPAEPEFTPNLTCGRFGTVQAAE